MVLKEVDTREHPQTRSVAIRALRGITICRLARHLDKEGKAQLSKWFAGICAQSDCSMIAALIISQEVRTCTRIGVQ
jgi:hypothetical protein